jgi:hypothetical protein
MGMKSGFIVTGILQNPKSAPITSVFGFLSSESFGGKNYHTVMKEFTMAHSINQEVNVSAVYFSGTDLRTFPREIEYGGGSVTFLNGLRYLVQRGAEAIRLFDMSTAEGEVYRLRQDGNLWTLLGTKGAAL